MPVKQLIEGLINTMSTLLNKTICLILPSCLFMAGAPDLSYSQDQMSLEHTPELAPTSVTLQIDQVLHFSDAQNQPAELTPGTYRLIPTPSNHLQFISTETQWSTVVHAQTFHHTEPLSAPSTLLIQDADSEERLHLLLFFSDGQGWDAVEQAGRPVRSRGGKFDAISSYSPKQRYTAVILQQGRVATDGDWNEQNAIPLSKISAPHVNTMHSFGRVRLERDHLQFDAKARQILFRRCRFCVKKP